MEIVLAVMSDSALQIKPVHNVLRELSLMEQHLASLVMPIAQFAAILLDNVYNVKQDLPQQT